MLKKYWQSTVHRNEIRLICALMDWKMNNTVSITQILTHFKYRDWNGTTTPSTLCTVGRFRVPVWNWTYIFCSREYLSTVFVIVHNTPTSMMETFSDGSRISAWYNLCPGTRSASMSKSWSNVSMAVESCSCKFSWALVGVNCSFTSVA